MKNLNELLKILLVVSFPLTISGCGVKGDPLVPAAPVTSP